MPMRSAPHHGEQLRVPERVIVAPAVGVFRPAPEAAPEGGHVLAGQQIGVIESRGHAQPVRSAFTGFLVGLLAHPGERVREGQPLAWLRVG